MCMQFGQDFGTASVGGTETLNLGPNIFPAQPGQLHQKLIKAKLPL